MNLTLLNPSFICSKNNGAKMEECGQFYSEELFINFGNWRSMGGSAVKMKVVVVNLNCCVTKMVGFNGKLKSLV